MIRWPARALRVYISHTRPVAARRPPPFRPLEISLRGEANTQVSACAPPGTYQPRLLCRSSLPVCRARQPTACRRAKTGAISREGFAALCLSCPFMQVEYVTAFKADRSRTRLPARAPSAPKHPAGRAPSNAGSDYGGRDTHRSMGGRDTHRSTVDDDCSIFSG